MQTLDDYLNKLASADPVPGGGSAAAIVAAASCSLVAMVARICAAGRKYEAVRDRALRLAEEADALRERCMKLRDEDEAAFEAVVAARGDTEAMQRALSAASATPLQGAKAALEALKLANEALALNNANLISDVGCAAEFGHAAMEACAYNVRINHKFMKDEHLVRSQAETLSALERDGAQLLQQIRTALNAALSP